MRINTNVASLNSQRILGQTGAKVANGIGRLSSGFRINKAADDAAGLGIANKLRADLRSMRQASRNAEQATSMLQVAEGATQTVQGIVERMKELAVQAASDNVSDRTQIQAEFVKLQDEITRIVDTTKFDGQALLNNTLGNYVDLADVATTLDAAAGFSAAKISGAGADTYTVSQDDGAVTITNAAGDLTQTVTVAQGGAQSIKFDAFGITLETHANFDITDGNENLSGDLVVAGSTTRFMVSVSGEEGGQDTVDLGAMDLRLATLGLNADNLSSRTAAEAAIGNIDSALGVVANVFGNIGAAQNRIDYATANVKTTIENVAAAESTIRDADMAAEMADFTKNQILQQAGVAMLAQANSAPQLVLRLLQ